MTAGLGPLTALGALLGLDGTSVGQFMVSRPLVAGLLAGWAVGDPTGGAMIGALLEIYLLVSYPTGGARFPEGPTATVVAVGVAAAFNEAAALPLAVSWGLLWGQAAGLSVSALRRWNARLVPERLEDGGRSIGAVHLSAIALDGLRAAVVTAVGIVLGRWAMASLVAAWPWAPDPSRALVLVGGGVSIGILLNDWGGLRKRGWLFAAGVAAGVAGGVFL